MLRISKIKEFNINPTKSSFIKMYFANNSKSNNTKMFS